MIIGWRAWYEIADGWIVYDSNMMAWEDLPDDGMLALRWYEDTEKPNNPGIPNGLKLTGVDYYFMAPGPQGEIMGGDIDRREINVKEEIKQRYPGAVVKRGKWTDPDTFDSAWQDVKAAQTWQ